MIVYNKVMKFKRKYPMTIAFRLKKHAEVIENVIDKDEKVLYAFCGQRNDTTHLLFDSCIVALTTKRIIVGEKRALFGYYLLTISTELFNDLKISTGILFGKVEIDTVKENLFISDIDKNAMDEIETCVNDIVLKNRHNFKKKQLDREKELKEE